MKKEIKEYLDSLSLGELMQYYKDAIRHAHYCPMQCYCFSDWKMKLDSYTISNYITKNYKKEDEL